MADHVSEFLQHLVDNIGNCSFVRDEYYGGDLPHPLKCNSKGDLCPVAVAMRKRDGMAMCSSPNIYRMAKELLHGAEGVCETIWK